MAQFAFLSLFGDNFGSAQLTLPTCLGQLRLGNKNILQIIATGDHSGRPQRETTAGDHSGRPERETTAGDHSRARTDFESSEPWTRLKKSLKKPWSKLCWVKLFDVLPIARTWRLLASVASNQGCRTTLPRAVFQEWWGGTHAEPVGDAPGTTVETLGPYRRAPGTRNTDLGAGERFETALRSACDRIAHLEVRFLIEFIRPWRYLTPTIWDLAMALLIRKRYEQLRDHARNTR